MFCPESDEEKLKREQELEAAEMFRNGVEKMNGYDTRKSIIQDGYEMAVKSLGLGHEHASGKF